MRNLLAGVVFLATVLVSASAFASGPSMHMREADRFITVLELQPEAGITYEPDFLRRDRRFLILGSIWPDIGRVLPRAQSGQKVDEGLVDPHNRHFVEFMLADALADYEASPWKVPFALGNLAHCTSDAVTQGLLVEHQAVRAGLGELDVVVGYGDDHPGGENEVLIEGGMEFMEPAFDYYVEMVQDFTLSIHGIGELAAAVTFFEQEWHAYFGGDDAADGLPVVLDALTDFPNHFPPCAPHAPAPLVRFARSGFLDLDALGDLSIDWAELARLLAGPAGNRAFWDDYYNEGFYQLTPTLLRTFQDGQPFFDDFPNWLALMMKSGVIQSLNQYLPDMPAGDDGRFIMALEWLPDDSTTPITSIDAASPPATVTLRVVFYETLGRTASGDVATLRVREDSADAPALASAAGNVHVDPWQYDQIGPPQLEVSFDPSVAIADGAAGLFAELAYGDDPDAPAYFTTNWAVYEQIDQLDMTKDCYTLNYAAYGREPYSLAIDYGRTQPHREAISPPARREEAEGGRPHPQPLSVARRGGQVSHPARREEAEGGWRGGHWTILPPLPAARVDPAAVVADDGVIYVVGGTDRHTTYPDGWRLAPGDESWTAIRDDPLQTSQAAAVWHDDRLFVVGGDDGEYARNMVMFYYPKHNYWDGGTTLHEGNYAGRLISTGERLFLIGGGDDQFDTKSTCWEREPVTGIWDPRAPMAYARKHFGATLIDGKIYVYGGVGVSGDAPVHLASAEVYDPGLDEWTSLPDMPVTWWGGASGASGGLAWACAGVQNGVVSAACFVFDPIQGAWSAAEDAPFAGLRVGSGGAGVLLVGGEAIDDRGHTVLANAAIWTESADDDDDDNDDNDDDNDDDTSPGDDDDDDDDNDDSSPGDDDDDDNDNDNDDDETPADDDDDNDDHAPSVDDDDDSGGGCGC